MGAYDTAILALSPAGYWPLINASGVAIIGNDLTALNGPTSSAVELVLGSGGSTSLERDNDQGFYAASHDSDLDFVGPSPYSVAFWARPVSATYTEQVRVILEQKSSSPDKGWRLYQGWASGASLSAWVADGTGDYNETDRTVFYADDMIIFCVITYDGTDIKWYSQGAYVVGSAWDPGLYVVASTGALIVGSESGEWSGFDGLLSHIALFDSVLTPSQIYNLYIIGQGMRIPSASVLDSFSGSLSGWTQGRWGEGSNASISGGKLITTGGGSGLSWNSAFPAGNLEAFCTVPDGTHNGAEAHLVLAQGTTMPGYSLMFDNDSGHYEVRKWSDNYSYTTKWSGTRQINAGDKIAFQVIDGSLYCWQYTGGMWTMFASGEDSTYTALTTIGIKTGGTANTYDDFGGGRIYLDLFSKINDASDATVIQATAV